MFVACFAWNGFEPDSYFPLVHFQIYVPDSWARQEYSRWAERHSDSVSPFIAGLFVWCCAVLWMCETRMCWIDSVFGCVTWKRICSDPQESFLKSLNLKDINYKSVCICFLGFLDIYPFVVCLVGFSS